MPSWRERLCCYLLCQARSLGSWSSLPSGATGTAALLPSVAVTGGHEASTQSAPLISRLWVGVDRGCAPCPAGWCEAPVGCGVGDRRRGGGARGEEKGTGRGPAAARTDITPSQLDDDDMSSPHSSVTFKQDWPVMMAPPRLRIVWGPRHFSLGAPMAGQRYCPHWPACVRCREWAATPLPSLPGGKLRGGCCH